MKKLIQEKEVVKWPVWDNWLFYLFYISIKQYKVDKMATLPGLVTLPIIFLIIILV